MLAQTIAEKLKAAGVTVKSYEEGDDALDGEVVITDEVSVQVGVLGDYAEVHRQCPDMSFQHYGDTTDLEKIIADIRKARDDAEAERIKP
jgi:hypothetical protein